MSTNQLVYEPMAAAVARSIIASGAYIVREHIKAEDDFFLWKSGVRAPVYTDCRILNTNPGARAIIKTALGSSLKANFPGADLIVGIAEAGVVWSALAADEISKPHAFIRKTPKKHGRGGKYVECDPPAGVKAVIVDDLVASGKSVISSVNALAEERGIEVIGIQSIVNWNFKVMRELFEGKGLRAKALVSYPGLLIAAREAGMIHQEAFLELSSFYANPLGHTWDLAALKTSDLDSKNAGHL